MDSVHMAAAFFVALALAASWGVGWLTGAGATARRLHQRESELIDEIKRIKAMEQA